MIHSPRSVSTTSTPAASSAAFRPVSSVAIDLDFTTGWRPRPRPRRRCSGGRRRRRRPAHVAAVGHHLVGELLEQVGQVGEHLLLRPPRAARRGSPSASSSSARPSAGGRRSGRRPGRRWPAAARRPPASAVRWRSVVPASRCRPLIDGLAAGRGPGRGRRARVLRPVARQRVGQDLGEVADVDRSAGVPRPGPAGAAGTTCRSRRARRRRGRPRPGRRSFSSAIATDASGSLTLNMPPKPQQRSAPSHGDQLAALDRRRPARRAGRRCAARAACGS